MDPRDRTNLCAWSCVEERYRCARSPLNDGMFNAIRVTDLDFWYHNYGDAGWYQVNEVRMRAARASVGVTYDYGWVEAGIIIGNNAYDCMYMDHIASATAHRTIIASSWVYFLQPRCE